MRAADDEAEAERDVRDPQVRRCQNIAALMSEVDDIDAQVNNHQQRPCPACAQREREGHIVPERARLAGFRVIKGGRKPHESQMGWSW